MQLRVFLFSVLLIVTAGCATTIIQPTQEDLRWAQSHWPAVTLQDLQDGRSLYVQKCASCHHLRQPAKYEPERWPQLVAKMRPNAKIDEAQAELLVRYLSTASERLRSQGE